MPLSPSTDNYYVGKGKISFKPTGATTLRDIGNVTELETTPNLTTLEHFSSREGVKKKDKEVVTEKKLTVRMVMDEWTADNLAMALLGDVSTVGKLTTLGTILDADGARSDTAPGSKLQKPSTP
jgi:hypothetical protein